MSWSPTAYRRNNIPRRYVGKVLAVPGATSALRKTVNCEVTAGEVVVVLSIPDVLGALVLKGAAYVEDVDHSLLA